MPSNLDTVQLCWNCTIIKIFDKMIMWLGTKMVKFACELGRNCETFGLNLKMLRSVFCEVCPRVCLLFLPLKHLYKKEWQHYNEISQQKLYPCVHLCNLFLSHFQLGNKIESQIESNQEGGLGVEELAQGIKALDFFKKNFCIYSYWYHQCFSNFFSL